ncbi:hypothetical protein RKD21_001597 [Streptomyces albogriseolus]|uniref:Uncharacterized protein n=1 Tax=Streptomyces albogriseolus TaxID=1887 RepID=A0ACC6UJJ9_STRAO
MTLIRDWWTYTSEPRICRARPTTRSSRTSRANTSLILCTSKTERISWDFGSTIERSSARIAGSPTSRSSSRL